MDEKEIAIKNNVIYEGKILTLNVDDVKCPNGNLTKREIVHHHGGVCVLANYEGYIYFVRQYRYAYDEFLLELPAGKLNKDEDPKVGGIRELEEETGLLAKDLIPMGVMYPSCGYSDEKIYLYLAKDVTKSHMHLDDDEFLDVIKFDIKTVKEMLDNNKINDAKTICLLYKFFNSVYHINN